MAKKSLIFLLLFSAFSLSSLAQKDSTQALIDSLAYQMDIPDLWKKIIHSKKPRKVNTSSTSALLPAIGYNPSMGFILGLNFVKSFYTGTGANRRLSIGQLDVSLTSKDMVIARFRHNIFKQNGRWNLQGNWQYMRNLVVDYGLGDTATRSPSVDYPIRYDYFRFTEKVYRKITNTFYAGAGVSIDVRKNINDQKLDSTFNTPHFHYSAKYGFSPSYYTVNGLLLNFQYNTRDHPNRAYKGAYADLVFRYNSKILGSTEESGQMQIEFRKYISLSEKNPDHVLALWTYGSFLLWGKLPYLEMPGTSSDTYNRSGRGYTFYRFRGQDYVYGEVEYRFPISQKTKLLSGVTFLNLQSASERGKVKLFEKIEPAIGVGLRIHFNKYSRTYLSVDRAWGRYNSKGYFFALNEAF